MGGGGWLGRRGAKPTKIKGATPLICSTRQVAHGFRVEGVECGKRMSVHKKEGSPSRWMPSWGAAVCTIRFLFPKHHIAGVARMAQSC